MYFEATYVEMLLLQCENFKKGHFPKLTYGKTLNHRHGWKICLQN